MRRWWRRRSLRARLMLIGIIGLTLGLIAGGVALAAVLGVALQRSLDAELDATVVQIVALAETDTLPVPLEVPAGDRAQVIDARGGVVAASAEADLLVPMLTNAELARVRGGEHITVHNGPALGRGGGVRVAGATASTMAGDPLTVVVARSLTDAMRGLGLLRGHLLVVFPLLVLAAALVAWRVIGASLRPVEQLRQGAEEITGAGAAAARLPVPAGNDEIHRLAVTLNDMLDRLESARARQREFVGDAAHELRSPLANIRTQLEVAGRLGDRADWPAVAEDVLADTTRLSRLVDDLLLLARADAAAPPSRPEPVELTALVRDVAQRPQDEDWPAAPVVRVNADSPVWTVGSADELRRIVANLVDNAVRHARTGVEISVHSAGPAAVITVTDDGPGIPPADRERVFERFTRLDDSRTLDTGGAGLGLAIVRELVRRHHGTVTLSDPDPDRGDAPGLRVDVRLPGNG